MCVIWFEQKSFEFDTLSSSDKERIAVLEAEVKDLKQALGNQAVKDYLARLREERWREICLSGFARKLVRSIIPCHNYQGF